MQENNSQLEIYAKTISICIRSYTLQCNLEYRFVLKSIMTKSSITLFQHVLDIV